MKMLYGVKQGEARSAPSPQSGFALAAKDAAPAPYLRRRRTVGGFWQAWRGAVGYAEARSRCACGATFRLQACPPRVAGVLTGRYFQWQNALRARQFIFVYHAVFHNEFQCFFGACEHGDILQRIPS